MFNKDWLMKVGIRTLRTFIQAFLGVLVAVVAEVDKR